MPNLKVWRQSLQLPSTVLYLARAMLIVKIDHVGDIGKAPQEPPPLGLTDTPSPSGDLGPDEDYAQQVAELVRLQVTCSNHKLST